MKFFVTFDPTQTALPFCAGCLVAANKKTVACLCQNFNLIWGSFARFLKTPETGRFV